MSGWDQCFLNISIYVCIQEIFSSTWKILIILNLENLEQSARYHQCDPSQTVLRHKIDADVCSSVGDDGTRSSVKCRGPRRSCASVRHARGLCLLRVAYLEPRRKLEVRFFGSSTRRVHHNFRSLWWCRLWLDYQNYFIVCPLKNDHRFISMHITQRQSFVADWNISRADKV